MSPASSVAFQVTTVVPTGNGEFSGIPSLRVAVTVTLVQLSDAVGVPRFTLAREQLCASAARSMLAGHDICGGVESTIVTVKVHDDVFPALSRAVTVTTVTPTGNVDPEAGDAVTVTGPPQLSEEVIVKVTLPLEHTPGSAVATIGAGHCMAGGVVSRTSIVCDDELLFGFVSGVVELTVAVFVNEPVVVQLVRARSENVSVLEAAISPMFHTCGFGPVDGGGVPLTRVSPAGS